MSPPEFEHRIAAHCETGTVRDLFRHSGLDLTEPMVFGIGGGIFFAYFAFKRFSFHKIVNRSKPGSILKNVVRRLGIKGRSRRFRRREKGMAALDEHLDQGLPVCLQVDMFHMDYMPEHMHIHFNAHFINVFARDGDEYLISDAYAPGPTKLHRRSLTEARFVLGDLAPRGFLFYPVRMPAVPDLARAVRAGIKDACFLMTRIPVGPLGVRGIRRFSSMIPRWPDIAESEDRLAHEMIMIGVTMEDMGTGGGGFRFMYASFLEQASSVLQCPALTELAGAMRENGDRWRDISLFAARMGKDRDFKQERFSELSLLISDRAAAEDKLFRDLAKTI